MKAKIIYGKALLLAMALLWSVSPSAIAQIDATAWTSVNGTTIWARLDGLNGDDVILHMRGKTYRVPVNRLAPKSIEKLERMLDLPAGKAKSLAGVKPSARTATIRPGATENHPGSRSSGHAPDLPPVEDLVIADASAADEDLPLPRTETNSITGPAALDLTSPLPELAGITDTDASCCGALLPPRGSLNPHQTPNPVSGIRLEGRRVIAPPGLPSVILAAIEAGNRLQTKSYKWGGGRARLEDSGYDCSGSVSCVLIKAGLLDSPLNSSSFTRFGAPGRGRWITIHARHGHVFMTICGLRLDTGGSGGRGESGPRWRSHMRGTSGFVMRHPPGF
jgi:hypothetical protein